nr:MAG TPA: hypothetical protein [Caudoviricetes sp.]
MEVNGAPRIDINHKPIWKYKLQSANRIRD